MLPGRRHHRRITMDMPTSDTARSIQHEPNRDYPDRVSISLSWVRNGLILTRSADISPEHFFGDAGAPIEGAAIIGIIERMRRLGPPEPPKLERKKNANTPPKRSAKGRAVATNPAAALRRKR